MEKSILFANFPNASKSSFIKVGGEYELVGKYVRVLPMHEEGQPDEWDVWICNAGKKRDCNPIDMTKGLSEVKVSALIKTLPNTISVNRLDGEAYFQTQDISLVRNWLETYRIRLGIKKRKPNPSGRPFLRTKARIEGVLFNIER